MPSTSPFAKHWIFTLHDYTDVDINRLRSKAESLEYLCYGREIAPTTGRPHLQGYLCAFDRIRFRQVKDITGLRAHVQVARRSPLAASTYAKKGGDFDEFGTLPEGQGNRSDLQLAREWVDDFAHRKGRAPSEREIALANRAVAVTHLKGLARYAQVTAPVPVLREGNLLDWQDVLNQELDEPSDDRKIVFYVDPVGGKGKTFFQQWYLTKFPDKVQILGLAKRDDMAHAVDETKEIFFINVPRGQMEYLQYSILEQLKDRCVFSPKYDSRMKFLARGIHVVVFANETPDESKLSADRWDIREL